MNKKNSPSRPPSPVPRKKDGYKSARIDARIMVPDDWTDADASGWVAKQLGFPSTKDQQHPRGFPLPCLGEFGITNLQPGDERPMMEHQLTGRVSAPAGESVVLRKANTGVLTMSISEAEVRDGVVTVEKLFKPFGGKRVVVTILEIGETS